MGTTLYSHRYSYRNEEGRRRKKRPRSFATKEAAARYAKQHDIADYLLVNIRWSGKGEKYRIVAKE
ncbi:MAG TPA: Arm DNA-binding domain-containing protein [Candidatus Nanoarchaeia archaeon]|nr:Arm DNA-binding domain-containing protein [Candidatus Nanoarchaeia archaeon]